MDSMCFLLRCMTMGREEWIHDCNKEIVKFLLSQISINTFVSTKVCSNILHFVLARKVAARMAKA